jgi:hypothetical protein
MAVLMLFVGLGMAATSYVALWVVITKAGYSGAWILLPLSLPVISLAGFFFSQVSLATGNVDGFFKGSLAVLVLTMFMSFANWVAFLVFAFSSWPALDYRARRRPDGGPRFDVAPRPSAPSASSSTTPTAAPRPSWDDDTPAPSNAPRGRAAAPPPTSVFCPWCGKQRPVDAIAIHHCGPKDRPRLYCSSCGSTLPEDDADCAACAAARPRHYCSSCGTMLPVGDGDCTACAAGGPDAAVAAGTALGATPAS